MDNQPSRIQSILQTLIQRSFFQYLALFLVVGVGSWLALHYGTNIFKNASSDTVRVWEQAGVAFGIALAVSAVAFFARLL